MEGEPGRQTRERRAQAPWTGARLRIFKLKKIFDLSQEQRKNLDKKMKELLEICQLYGVPMFASAAVANSTEDTEYLNILFGAKAHNIQLANDQIQRHILIANNFRAVPPREDMELSMGDLFGTMGGGDGDE